MGDDRTDHLERLRGEVAAGAYVVDAHAVADAMLRRLVVSRDGAHVPARRSPPDPRP
jgi:hypothetical protein